MADEPPGDAGRVQWRHQVNGTLWQDGAKQAGRCLRLAGEEEHQIRAQFQQALTEFEQKLAFADAGPVQPDQRTAGHASRQIAGQTLIDATIVFFAGTGAPLQHTP